MIGPTPSVTGTTLQKMPQPSEQVDATKNSIAEDPGKSQSTKGKSTLQSTELLNKIKELTDNGTYSVQFETDSNTGKMIIKVVQTATGKVIRQIPPEALLGVDQALTEFSGNFVNTQS